MRCSKSAPARETTPGGAPGWPPWRSPQGGRRPHFTTHNNAGPHTRGPRPERPIHPSSNSQVGCRADTCHKRPGRRPEMCQAPRGARWTPCWKCACPQLSTPTWGPDTPCNGMPDDPQRDQPGGRHKGPNRHHPHCNQRINRKKTNHTTEGRSSRKTPNTRPDSKPMRSVSPNPTRWAQVKGVGQVERLVATSQSKGSNT